MKHIYLNINLDVYAERETLNWEKGDVSGAQHEAWSWKSDDLSGTLASLPGLRNPHLTIEQSLQGDLPSWLEILEEGFYPCGKRTLSTSTTPQSMKSRSLSKRLTYLSCNDGLVPGYTSFVDLQREGLQRIADRAGYARAFSDKLLAI